MEERASRGIRIRGEEEEAPEGTYTIEALCENCDWLGEVEIPKGTAITRGESVGRYARCDDCGCYTLLRCVLAEEEEESVAPIGQEAIAPQYDDEADHLEELLRRMREQDRMRRDEERRRRQPPVTPFPAHPIPVPAMPSPPEPWRRPNRDGVWIGDPPPGQRTSLECDYVGEAGGIMPASQVPIRKVRVDPMTFEATVEDCDIPF